jgi:hypothetical protein
VKKYSFSYFLISVFFMFFGIFLSCKKPIQLSKENLTFSVDTLVFDTVFTTVGSATQNFKIYNRDNKNMMIEEVQLMGGSNSPFRINLDGVSGVFHKDISIQGKDSLFVFVDVTLSVNNQPLPMIVEDSIRFKSNGKDQYVKLAVWGQDAYFHYADINEGIWPNDKPHVIYNYAAVDSASTLTIQEGTRVYLHKNSILYVYKGSLQVEGVLGNEVVFQGDRLENFYQDVSGQWYGIYFQEAQPSHINYAIIKNGTAGIHLFSSNESNPAYTLEVKNSIILNNASYGIFLYARAKVKIENSIIAKSGSHGFLILEGGDFFINHCHLLGYGAGNTSASALAIKNYYTVDGVTNVSSINVGNIYNSVIYGGLSNEIVYDTLNPNGVVNLNFSFKNCLIKQETSSAHSMYENIFWNINPDFIDIGQNNFLFQNTSILNGSANPLFSLPSDILGKTRSATNPDIGAYEVD